MERMQGSSVTEAEQRAAKIARINSAGDKLFNRVPTCHWMEFYSAIFGIHGIIRRELGPMLLQSHKTDLVRVCEQLRILRELTKHQPFEPTTPAQQDDATERVITVRLPRAVHAALHKESREREMSLNQLCVSKLIRLMD